jgi:hypothetical protein
MALDLLSDAEIAHFVREGFVVKRRVLDPGLCRQARDRFWGSNLAPSLRRDDPATWLGGTPEREQTSDPAGMNDRSDRYMWRLRELGGDENMIELLPRRIWPWLEQLLGAGQVVEPVPTHTPSAPDPRGTRLRGWPFWAGRELRGLYGVLPEQRTPSSPSFDAAARASAHNDPIPSHLVACALVDDVAPGGGGLALFPRTHTALFEADSQGKLLADIARSFRLNLPHPTTGAGCWSFVPTLNPDVVARVKDASRPDAFQPVEFCGSGGDVMLWHARVFHGGTPNYNPGTIRKLLLYDVASKDVNQVAYEHYHREKYPRPSMAPTIRKRHGFTLGPEVPQPSAPQPRPSLWAEWSEDVQRIADGETARL